MRRAEGSLARTAAVAGVVLVLAACGQAEVPAVAKLTTQPSSGPCPVTLAVSTGQIPPAVAAFMVGGMLLPSGMTPPPLQMYGNDALWTELGTGDGTLQATSGSDGLLEAKFPTYRLVDGSMTVNANRLDGPSDGVQVEVPTGYGAAGFQAVGVSFPAPGCWSITETVAGHNLAFVVRVVAGP